MADDRGMEVYSGGVETPSSTEESETAAAHRRPGLRTTRPPSAVPQVHAEGEGERTSPPVHRRAELGGARADGVPRTRVRPTRWLARPSTASSRSCKSRYAPTSAKWANHRDVFHPVPLPPARAARPRDARRLRGELGAHRPVVRVLRNQPAAALLLLENRGPEPRRQGARLEHAAHLAAHRGHKEIVALLLQYGADAKKQNTNNRTAYDLARFERWGFPALQKRETARLLEAWAAAPVGVPVVEGNAFGDRRVEFTSSLATIDALALLVGAGLEDRAPPGCAPPRSPRAASTARARACSSPTSRACCGRCSATTATTTACARSSSSRARSPSALSAANERSTVSYEFLAPDPALYRMYPMREKRDRPVRSAWFSV